MKPIASEGYDRKEHSEAFAYTTEQPSLTIASMAEDTDLNVIMKRFGVTGQFPDNPRIPQYGDFTHITDFRTAVEAVRTAQEAFLEFPAELRARFGNDPQAMVEFAALNGGKPLQEMIDGFKESKFSTQRVAPATAGPTTANPAAPAGSAAPHPTTAGGSPGAALQTGGPPANVSPPRTT